MAHPPTPLTLASSLRVDPVGGYFIAAQKRGLRALCARQRVCVCMYERHMTMCAHAADICPYDLRDRERGLTPSQRGGAMRAQQSPQQHGRSEWPDQHSADDCPARGRAPRSLGDPSPLALGCHETSAAIRSQCRSARGEGGRPSKRPPEEGRFMTCVPAQRTRGGVRRARRPTSCLRRGAQ